MMCVAAERAARRTVAPGSFAIALIDELAAEPRPMSPPLSEAHVGASTMSTIEAASATLAGLGYGLIQAEAKITRKIVGNPFDGAPDDDGVYGAAPGEPVQLLVLGDSTAAGMGADNRYQTIGAILATGLAAIMGRPVELTNEAVIGAESSDLPAQLSKALARVDQPDVAVILIGANDVTHRIDRSVSVQHLQRTVRYLRTLDVPVVVGADGYELARLLPRELLEASPRR